MSLTATDTIVILSTPGCQRCKTVARHLDNKGIEYSYLDLTDPANAEVYEEFKRRNLTQVPQTFRGDGTWVEGVDFASIEKLF
jgi:glutaredoxin